MRFSAWPVLFFLLTTYNNPEIPAVVLPEVSTFDEEAFNALSDSILLQALYEVTGLTPLPDTLISQGDTVFTVIQILEHQPFNAPFKFTRIEGNNYDDEVSIFSIPSRT